VVSRITARSNPRLLLIFAMMLLSVGAAAAVFFLLGTWAGILAGAAAFVVCHVLFTFLRRQLASRIETREDGISFNLHGDDPRFIGWEEIRMAGIAEEPGRFASLRRLFVYKEDGDVLVVIPDEFEGFEELSADVRARTAFHDIGLERGESLSERLKQLLEKG
jgi:hypothetical protein